MADTSAPSSPGTDPRTQPDLPQHVVDQMMAPIDAAAADWADRIGWREQLDQLAEMSRQFAGRKRMDGPASATLEMMILRQRSLIDRWVRQAFAEGVLAGQPPESVSPALTAARALLASVDHDNNGETIGLQRMGGNGGLISLKTTRAADTLRLALDKLDSGS